LVEVADDGGCLGNKAAIGQLQRRRFAPRIHFQVPPLPLLANRRHIVDLLLKLIGNTFFVHEQT